MKRFKKGIAVLCSMVIAIILLFPCAVMKAKAEETATANLTIHFVESINGNAESSITKTVAITIGNDGTGTIDLAGENITYDKGNGDIRYVVSWYNESKESISSSYNIGAITAGKTKDIELYAVYGAAIEISFNNNASYMNAENSIIITKYYPQKDASQTEETISLPATPAELSSEFVFNGYTFKGWGESDSGNVEISEITLGYGSNKTVYAHWQNQGQQGAILDFGQYYLEAGMPYTLGDGTWTVNGGTTKYSGGITFYVTTAGNYTFSK